MTTATSQNLYSLLANKNFPGISSLSPSATLCVSYTIISVVPYSTFAKKLILVIYFSVSVATNRIFVRNYFVLVAPSYLLLYGNDQLLAYNAA
jgi:hypothetical protein